MVLNVFVFELNSHKALISNVSCNKINICVQQNNANFHKKLFAIQHSYNEKIVEKWKKVEPSVNYGYKPLVY